MTAKFAHYYALCLLSLQRLLGHKLPSIQHPPLHETVDWHQDAHRARLMRQPLRAHRLLYAIVITLLSLLLWAAFAHVDEVTRGQAKVIPSQQVKIIQSVDGGVITDIHVKEGDEVAAGEKLLALDPTRSVSNLRESQVESWGLAAKVERLQALSEGRDFLPSQKLGRVAPQVVEHERMLFESSKQQLQTEMDIARDQLTQSEQQWQAAEARYKQFKEAHRLAVRELQVTEPLVTSGAVSQVELIRLKQTVTRNLGERDDAVAQKLRFEAAIAESKNKVKEVELAYKNRAREELNKTLTQLQALREQSLGLSDRVKQTDLRSPVRGTVKRLLVNTIGGVVQPGSEVAEILPLDDSLVLEVRIRPQDIAFLRPGQKALVKFTAYDFTVYGGLEAKLEHIGVDTFTDEEGQPYYNVRVRTLEASLGDDKPIIPGMVAQVDILTGKKTILNYLMKPILRAKQQSLSER